MVELVQHSAQNNIQDIHQQAPPLRNTPEVRIERAFLEASRDPSRIGALADHLRKNGLWEKYEDRFFALVKASNHST